MTPQQRLLRMRRTFAKARAVLAEDYNHFVKQPDRHGSFKASS